MELTKDTNSILRSNENNALRGEIFSHDIHTVHMCWADLEFEI
jgi:hypothetical protein